MSIRAVLTCTEAPPEAGWPQLLLHTRVGGLSLLHRHLLALRQAGIQQVSLVVPPAMVPEFQRGARVVVPAGLTFDVVCDRANRPQDGAPVLEQRADTVIDPRLLAQVARLAATLGTSDLVCLDSPAGAADPELKSPYTAGVPDPDEAKPADPEAASGMVPIGLAVRAGGQRPPVTLDVGRYYWQRVRDRAEAAMATRKVLLSTMKATDGIFARTNRRVSLRITRLLLNAPITPNMVTIATLVWGLVAGWFLAQGRHSTFVLGALFAWFASMLDGVDGEIARAKFQTSSFGHWLEMVCDYVFYIALFVGLGAGVQRIKGDPIWLAVGAVAGIGVVVSFGAVARLKRAYARQGAMGDFYLAYQRTVDRSNLYLRITRHLVPLMTRAGFPYLMMVIALLDMPRALLVTIFVTTHSFWITALAVSRLRVTLQPSSARTSAPQPVLRPSRSIGIAEIE